MWFINFVGIKGLLIGSVMLVLGFGISWQVQEYRHKSLQAEIKTVKDKITKCQDANYESQKTISQLKDEVLNANKICKQRLSIRDKVSKQIKAIDKHSGGQVEKDNSDPILDELNSMFRQSGS